MSRKNAALGRFSILGTTLIWGTSFVILKATLDSVPPLYILAFRFTGAAALMLLLGLFQLRQMTRRDWICGAKMGAALFGAYIFQTYGLLYTTPGKNAFLTATYCVIVPFLAWGMGRQALPRRKIACAALCLCGIALVSLESNLTIGLGDGLTLIGGFFFALHILLTDSYLPGRSLVLLNLIQFAVCGICAWITALLFVPMPAAVPREAVWSVVYLCVMCTGVCFLLQTIGQKYTPPATAAILLTLESVFGALFSVLFYDEQITVRLGAGFVAILCSVVLAEWQPSRKKVEVSGN